MSNTFELPKTPSGCYMDFSKPMGVMMKSDNSLSDSDLNVLFEGAYLELNGMKIANLSYKVNTESKNETEISYEKIVNVVNKALNNNKNKDLTNKRRKRKN